MYVSDGTAFNGYIPVCFEPQSSTVLVKTYKNPFQGNLMRLFQKAVKLKGVDERDYYVNVKSLGKEVVRFAANPDTSFAGMGQETLKALVLSSRQGNNTFMKKYFPSINFPQLREKIQTGMRLDKIELADLIGFNEDQMNTALMNLRKTHAADKIPDSYPNIQSTLQELGLKSRNGDKDAQFELGILYDKGQHVAGDTQKALNMYESSALQGHANAQNNLGTLYELENSDSSYKKACAEYLKAVKQKNPVAMTNLGVLYLNGKGVKKDVKYAINLFQEAVLLGNVNAITNLGWIFYNGEGYIRKNVESAKKLFLLAARFGEVVAIQNLSKQ